MEISILNPGTVPHPSPNSDYALNKAHRKQPETRQKHAISARFFHLSSKQNTTFPSRSYTYTWTLSLHRPHAPISSSSEWSKPPLLSIYSHTRNPIRVKNHVYL